MDTPLTFFIPGRPIGKGRPRFVRAGDSVLTYTPKTTRTYEDMVAMIFRSKKKDMFKGYISISVTAYFPIPKSASKALKSKMLSGELLPDKKPDLDNIIKTVLDGLNGVAFLDDKAVIKIAGSKRYSTEPGVAVMIQTIPNIAVTEPQLSI